jgi:hypothetical protein
LTDKTLWRAVFVTSRPSSYPSSSHVNPGDLRDGRACRFESAHAELRLTVLSVVFVLFRSVVCSAPTTSKPSWLPSSTTATATAITTITTGTSRGFRGFCSCCAPQRRLDAKSEFGVDVGLVGINGPLSRTRQLPVPARAVVGAVVVLVLLPADAALILLLHKKRPQGRDEAYHESLQRQPQRRHYPSQELGPCTLTRT